jgi:hypothetical protein
MDALKIALETIFVGVLALPWLALASQLFFPKFSLSRIEDFEGWLPKLWSIKNEAIGYAVVGVLSVAMAYTLGASISRLAQDFFNDDDLLTDYLPTEDQIRASVYLDPRYSDLVESRLPVHRDALPYQDDIPVRFRGSGAKDDLSTSDRIREIFSLQEAALLLGGEEKVSRLRLLHQQMMVLRGAAFNGLITCLLCWLGWNAKRDWKLWQRWLLPTALLLYALYALLWNHLKLLPHPDHFLFKFDDPPLMELTLVLLAAGAGYVVWKRPRGSWPQGTGWVSLLFGGLAYAGWYWTEILYDRLIIYSFYASQHPLLKLTQ